MGPDRWREIRAAFDELVALEPAHQAERLAVVEAVDPELRRAVEALLRADTDADQRLAGLSHAFAPPALAPFSDAPLSDPLALRGRTVAHFRILAPLGTGGMGVVYAAEDTRLGRTVALKLPLPAQRLDSSARARFLQEARSVGALDHPNLCSVYEAGESEDGLLFLAMALYPGDTLKARLGRNGALPVVEAVELARQIALGLAAAHEAGIVHRDLKPANVMLPGGTVKILDFGLAKVRDLSLTGSGALLGTAAYMSPEQIRGDPVDARADLWSLGVVLYEMLTGRPPFRGENEISVAHAIVHRHPVRPSALRDGISPALEDVILALLDKVPARRPPTARAVEEQLAVVERGRSHRTAALRRWLRGRWSRAAAWIAAAAGLLAVLLAVALVGSRRSPAAPLDSNLIAVFPFRVVGGDTGHGALREGMVDILEAQFSGAGGPRVVPARTALAAWRQALGPQRREMTAEEARGVARRLGAGGVVLGTVVGMPGRLILNGSLLDVGAGRVRAEAKTEGRPDSLHVLIDRFAAQLAALGAGESADRLSSLTSTSLPALYAYLAGKAAHRAGRYRAAVQHFGRALELDSTFARAALGYSGSAAWNADPAGMEDGVRLASRHRDRLGPRDRVILEALAGPWDPGGPRPRERVLAWEEAVRQVPDDPELLYQLGDAYFHVGAAAGIEEPFRRAAEAFNRALALDTALSLESMVHLMVIAAMDSDTVTVRRLVSRMPEDDPGTAMHRLEAGAVLGDSAMLSVARSQFDSVGSVGTMRWLASEAVLFGVAVQEAERVIGPYLERSRWGANEVFPILDFFAFYHELGRPAAAAAALASLDPKDAATSVVSRMILSQAQYGYVDPATVAEVLGRLGAFTTGPVARDPAARQEQDRSICVMERWRLSRGDTRTARAAIARLPAGAAWGCRVILEAQLAAAEHRPDADAAFGRLDSLLLAGGGRPEWVIDVARWREAGGDITAALRVSRQCRQFRQLINLSYCLREEARLAALAGDRTGAIEAYRHYLALRYNPESSVQPEVDRVRAELARLMSGAA